MMSTRRDCAVDGCTRLAPQGRVICGRCWREVPADLKEQLKKAWQAWSKWIKNDVGRAPRDTGHDLAERYRSVLEECADSARRASDRPGYAPDEFTYTVGSEPKR